MPLIGLALGTPQGRAIGSAADYLVVGILIVFGFYTLLDPENERVAELPLASRTSSLALGVSISLDELAIGFSLGLLRLPVTLVIALIAMRTVMVTQLGLLLGHRRTEQLCERAERLAGLALTILGFVLVTEQLTT